MNESSLSLFIVFIGEFDPSKIYDVGWSAAQSWMALISGTIMAIAIGIRHVEEQVSFIRNGKAGFAEFVIDALVMAFALALYFTIAYLVIDFFNAIYGLLSDSPLVQLTGKLDATLDDLFKKEHEFSWSEIGDTIFAAFGFIVYWSTHLVLVLVTLAMRIAHAVLVSFVLFWGAVALPMSITKGLKMLTGFKNLALLALIWPIVEHFFMFCIGYSLQTMLEGSALDTSSFDKWNMGYVVFYLTAFSVINLLLAAAIVAAPLLAQGVANNSGNATGMIASFAAGGVAAGLAAAKSLSEPTQSATQAGLTKGLGQQAPDGVAGAVTNVATGVAPAAAGLAKEAAGGLKAMAQKAMAKPEPENFAKSTGVGLSSGNATSTPSKNSGLASSSKATASSSTSSTNATQANPYSGAGASTTNVNSGSNEKSSGLSDSSKQANANEDDVKPDLDNEESQKIEGNINSEKDSGLGAETKNDAVKASVASTAASLVDPMKNAAGSDEGAPSTKANQSIDQADPSHEAPGLSDTAKKKKATAREKAFMGKAKAKKAMKKPESPNK